MRTRKLILNIGLVLAIIYVVPFVVYGVGSVVAGLKPPEGASPARFLISVFVCKFGTAVCFVLIFYFARQELSGRWVLYPRLALCPRRSAHSRCPRSRDSTL